LVREAELERESKLSIGLTSVKLYAVSGPALVAATETVELMPPKRLWGENSFVRTTPVGTATGLELPVTLIPDVVPWKGMGPKK
jgi:hypothetical protein